MAMFRKVAGKAKTLTKKEAEKLIKANRQTITEEEEDDKPKQRRRPNPPSNGQPS